MLLFGNMSAEFNFSCHGTPIRSNQIYSSKCKSFSLLLEVEKKKTTNKVSGQTN